MRTHRQRHQETEEERRARQQSFTRGSMYLIAAIAVLFLLTYFIPDVLGIDFAGLMKTASVVALLRIGLGVVLLVILVASIARAIHIFTLEGEDWKRGLRNAAATHLFSRDALSILLLLLGGVALIAWGLVDIFR